MKKIKYCSVEGCVNKHQSRGYCQPHYYIYCRRNIKGVVCMKCGNISRKSEICYKCKLDIKKNKKKYNIVNDNDVRLILTKWKWNYVDELLYFRTVSLYVSIWGLTKDASTIELNSNPAEFMKYCICGLKRYLEIRKEAVS